MFCHFVVVERPCLSISDVEVGTSGSGSQQESFHTLFLYQGIARGPTHRMGSKGQVSCDAHVQLRPRLIATPAGALSDEETEAQEG